MFSGWKIPPYLFTKYVDDYSNLMRLYLDILYSHGRYEDVIDEFDKSNFLFNNNVKGLQSLDLVSFSCFKIGTRESLKKNIQEVLPIYQGKFESDRLVLQFTAMHAFNVEEYAVAMMYVQKLKESTRFVHPFHIDLEILRNVSILCVLQADY